MHSKYRIHDYHQKNTENLFNSFARMWSKEKFPSRGKKGEERKKNSEKKKKKRETFPENFSYLLRFLLDFSRMIKKIFKKYSLRSNFFFVSPFKIIYKKRCTYAEFIRDRVDYYLSVIFWDRNVRKIIGDVQWQKRVKFFFTYHSLFIIFLI